MDIDASSTRETALVVCGANESSQLGLEVADAVLRLTPLPPLSGVRLELVTLGLCHALWLDTEGMVHAVGLNDVGQCGLSSPEQLTTPKRLDVLSTKRAVRVRAGASFSAVVTDQGEVLTFGANDFGQCGQGEGAPLEVRRPRAVRSVPAVCDVACGSEHMLLLDRGAAVHACGQGAHGALGLGDVTSRAAPEKLRALAGSGVRQVACGDAHSAALTFGGKVLAWGQRRHGALGLPLAAGAAVMIPRRVPGLAGVVALACGGTHTLALLADGGVLAWGRGDEGALGVAAGAADRHAPSPVALPAGARCVAVAAGSAHSLALLDDGRVFSWGSARCGQLGASDPQLALVDAPTPALVALPPGGAPPSAVAAGGHSTALLLGGTPPAPAAFAPPTLSAEAVKELCAAERWLELTAAVDAVFGSPALLAASFTSGAGDVGGAQHAALEATYVALLSASERAPSLLDALSASLPRLLTAAEEALAAAASEPPSPQRPAAAHSAAAASTASTHSAAYAATVDAGASGPPPLQRSSSLGGRGPALASALGVPLLATLQSPLLSHESNAVHLRRAAAAVDLAPAACRTLMVESLASGCPPEVFASRLVRPAAAALERAMQAAVTGAAVGGEVVPLVRWLGLLRDASMRGGESPHRNGPLVGEGEFYSRVLSEQLDVRSDYLTWARHGPSERGAALSVPFTFCSEPWLFNAAAKARLLKVEAEVRMSQSIEQAQAFARAGGGRASSFVEESVLPPAKRRPGSSSSGRTPYFADARAAAASPYLVLRVRREHLVADTLDCLAEETVSNLLKPLRVIFEGEPAIDEGGVRKEFFLLLLEQLFRPEYGMWVYSAQTRCHWFPRGGGVGGAAEYFLVGLVIGLALHGGLYVCVCGGGVAAACVPGWLGWMWAGGCPCAVVRRDGGEGVRGRGGGGLGA